MSKVPEDLKYTKDHEWIRLDGETATVGITDHAQESLGDITFVEMPDVGDSFSAGDAFGVVESVKAASDLYFPIDGEVIEVNGGLEDSPETVNSDPYGDGWIIKLKVTGSTDGLLDAAAYSEISD